MFADKSTSKHHHGKWHYHNNTVLQSERKVVKSMSKVNTYPLNRNDDDRNDTVDKTDRSFDGNRVKHEDPWKQIYPEEVSQFQSPSLIHLEESPTCKRLLDFQSVSLHRHFHYNLHSLQLPNLRTSSESHSSEHDGVRTIPTLCFDTDTISEIENRAELETTRLPERNKSEIGLDSHSMGEANETHIYSSRNLEIDEYQEDNDSEYLIEEERLHPSTSASHIALNRHQNTIKTYKEPIGERIQLDESQSQEQNTEDPSQLIRQLQKEIRIRDTIIVALSKCLVETMTDTIHTEKSIIVLLDQMNIA